MFSALANLVAPVLAGMVAWNHTGRILETVAAVVITYAWCPQIRV